MKTYFVTGGAGFIGSNFVLHILNTYPDVRIVNVDKLTYAGNLENLASVLDDERHIFIQADICDRTAMAQAIDAYKPDFVVNFAAESHVDRSIVDPGIFCQTNVAGTQTLLDVCRDAWKTSSGYGDHKFLQVSTDEVYGSLPEDDKSVLFREDTPLAPRSPYSASKASADLFVKAYHETYGMPVNITRCSNNYGPFQFPEKLIPLMFHNACNHVKLPVYGDGMNIRDWLYVEDHCRAIDLVLNEAPVGEVYNIGGHNERTNIHIVEQVIQYVHNNIDTTVDASLIEHVTDRLGHDRRYGIDPTKIGRDLGWQPETPFEVGIIKTLDWYRTHQAWIDNVTSGQYQSYYERMYKNREVLS
ncbi:MAG: dTDP-glucose 4,6-dehydratase [Coriobacteriales bacterium]|nr:dTDP-glucose 4,6-dehydratase [Coriobacteriales bacterium]